MLFAFFILFGFSACSSDNLNNDNLDVSATDNSVVDSSDANNTLDKTISWMGNEYPTMVELDFEVHDMVYTNEADSGVNLVVFCSMDYDEFSDNIENYDFSNGPAKAVGIIYDLPYNEVIEGKAKILGSYEITYTGKNSDSFSGWQVLYDPDGELIYKTDVNMTLECGLHENYYDKNNNAIASYYGWDNENETSLWKDSNGDLIDEAELRNLLKNMCPNDYLKNFI